jgi:hypothetical protein
MIIDWSFEILPWERQEDTASHDTLLGVSEEEIRSFVTKELFPEGHNVGMLVIVKETDGYSDVSGPQKIEAMSWKFETEPNHVWKGNWERMDTQPEYSRYRAQATEISNLLPCTLPINASNIVQCLKSMKDEGLSQLYNELITGGGERMDFETQKGLTWADLETRITYHPPKLRGAKTLYVLVTGKQWLDFPAINADMGLITKT